MNGSLSLRKLPALVLLAAVSCGAQETNSPVASAPGVRVVSVMPETEQPTRGCAKLSVAPTDLSRSIRDVIQRREFVWRFPRDKVADQAVSEQSFLSRFFDEVGETFKRWWKPVRRLLKKMEAWIEDLVRRWRPEMRAPREGGDWRLSVQILGVVLLGIVACTLGVFLWRHWRRRHRPVQLAQAVAVPVPDLRAEEVQADQMPADEWQLLAREMLSKGELRLALRAFYLSTLAFLAQHEWLSIAKHKTNREYERELGRRAASRGDMVQAFSQNVGLFERAWYGHHEVKRENVDSFMENHQKIKTRAEE
jgi:hypothetical protein